MVEAESRRDALTEEKRRRSEGESLREAERSQRLRSGEAGQARRAKLVRQGLTLGLFVVLLLGAWLWERASPPDLRVSEPTLASGSDPFAYSLRDAASARGGGFTFDVSAPERTREDAVDYRFHMRKTADSDLILLPTKVTLLPPEASEAEPRTCRLGEPGERPGRGEQEVGISDARVSFQWGCEYEFPSPPSYLDPSELPNNSTWPMRFEVHYRTVRFLPLGFWASGSGSVDLEATTTVVYRD